MTGTESPSPQSAPGDWFLAQRRRVHRRWAGGCTLLGVSIAIGSWLLVRCLDGPARREQVMRYVIGVVALLCFVGCIQAVTEYVQKWRGIERDHAVRRLRGWGELDEVVREILRQLEHPVASASGVIFTQDYIVPADYDVRRIDEIVSIWRYDTVRHNDLGGESERTRHTELVFANETLSMGSSGSGAAAQVAQALVHCQRRAPWLCDSLGVAPSKLRPPAQPPVKPKRPQGPVVKNPPTRRQPPRSS